MRDDPSLTKSAFGKEVQRAAIQKVRGTPWEKYCLFPKQEPISLETERAIRAFRKKDDAFYEAWGRIPVSDAEFAEHERKSKAYIAERKKLAPVYPYGRRPTNEPEPA